ncbi:MAG: agmatine deiminase family protein [Pseudomonadota bacterium]
MENRRQPAEWEPHDAVWIGWPSDASLWGDDLGQARAEVEDFIRAILFPDDDPSSAETSERVQLVARGGASVAAAEIMRGKLPDPELLNVVEAPIGDIWLRDTGPMFTKTNDGAIAASAFTFNGWGGKYKLPEDHRIANILAGMTDTPLRRFDGLVCEGGALETDGQGTFITTRQCLLNKNRNPSLSEKDIEVVLKQALGAEKVIWLDEGLSGDHTDGHVDNIARFIAPGTVACMRPHGDDDPNANVLPQIEKSLLAVTDAQGSKLDIVTVPSPGRVELEGAAAAASHLNFYISNRALIMPSYSRLTGDDRACLEALETLRMHVLRKHAFAIDSSHLLTGGGSFHCISQQQPAR